MNYVESPTARDPHRPSLGAESPFFETPAGELFFRNMLFVTPVLIVLVPVLMKAVLTTLGFLSGPSRVFDTFPIVAGYALPWVGWLFAFAIPSVLRNLKMDISPRLRGLLFAFLLIHIGVLASTVLAWTR